MAHQKIAMELDKKIALVAHDNKKRDLVEWAKFNRVRGGRWFKRNLLLTIFAARNCIRRITPATLGIGDILKWFC